MDQQQNEQRTYQEPFPYKTYDEILLEKERRLRFRHGMVVMSGIFLMFCAVIIGISMTAYRVLRDGRKLSGVMLKTDESAEVK